MTAFLFSLWFPVGSMAASMPSNEDDIYTQAISPFDEWEMAPEDNDYEGGSSPLLLISCAAMMQGPEDINCDVEGDLLVLKSDVDFNVMTEWCDFIPQIHKRYGETLEHKSSLIHDSGHIRTHFCFLNQPD
jgi:hypothetical protein